MDVTLQYFRDCPNWKTTRDYLETLIAEHALDATLRYQLIETPEAATEHGFRGSPTVLVEGTDPFADPNAPVGLSCRAYTTEEGQAGSPTLAQLRHALLAASGEE